MPAPRKPRIIIFDVPRQNTEQAIISAMYTQNKEICGTRTVQEARKEKKLIFETSRRETATEQWGLVNADLRNVLPSRNHLYGGGW